ncbi:translation initiation factor IF-1A [Candidatus Pacearchaeota archaeon]|nr:MAG: translation initiation factor IF-1A [Candidatus Pacearchaeota archaeon]
MENEKEKTEESVDGEESSEESAVSEEEQRAQDGSSAQLKLPSRIRKPKEGEFLGLVLQRLGGNRMLVKTTDGKVRNCRVPGRFSRRFWVLPGNVVIIKPWEFDDSKADIIYQYRKDETTQIKKSGVLDDIE